MPSATKDRDKQKRRDREKTPAKGAPKGAAAGKTAVLAKPKGKTKSKDKGHSKNKGKAKGKGKPAELIKSKAKAKAKSSARPKAPKLTAASADRYDLYQRSVNSPEADVDFLIKVYERLRDGRQPRHLREDFCGTANLAAEWLKRDAAMTAEGFDLDPEPIEWGKRENFTEVPDGLARMTFHVADVRSRALVKPDVATAPNFSYWCFHTRAELKGYFRSAYEGLAQDGVFVIDVYGGPEALVEMEEERVIGGGLTYVWDQRQYWPGTGEYHAAIHFQFKDGTELRDAFEYHWRFWNLTELKDLLSEVGFRGVTTWFEGTDPDDDESGDGNFELDERGENCQAWIGYIVAAK